jgi:hypothetical protein
VRILPFPPEAPVSRQPPTDDDQKPSQQELQDPSDDEDDEDALPGDSPQDSETDEDEDGEDLEEEVRLASDSQDVRPGDAPQQPAIDNDDDEDVPTDGRDRQRAADDDDEEPSQGDDEEEAPADASDHEDAPSADAPVMQTAKADAGADVTADDQAGPLLATSAPTPDEGFSFSLFTRPDAPAEVAKEAMPAGQLSPQDPGAETPAGESAHPDLESQDVGNAAPSKDPVVHHGELAP